jgi:SPP1 family predicted phage head-tail adaptor
MYWNSKVKLGKKTETITHGEVTTSTTWTTVFANKKGVRQSEFYSAAGLGLQPELMFEVHSNEFDGHTRLQYDSKTYEIIRVYDRGEVTELTVSGMVGDLSG